MHETTSDQNPAAPTWLEVPQDFATLDTALWPQGTHRDSTGHLTIAGHQVESLIKEFGSPLYVIDEADFRSRARQFADHFPGWEVHYAGKSFLCRTVVRWIDQEGLSLDVCSGNELAVALSVGFPPERIGLHGNNKSIQELSLAIESGVGSIIVDSFDEIVRIEDLAAQQHVTVRVLVRVTTGVEAHTHEYIATSHEDGKFGFSINSGQALQALVDCDNSPHIHLGCIHSHIGSQIFDTEGFRVAAQRTMALAAQFHDLTSHTIEEINLGGGFGIAYTSRDTPMNPVDLNRGLVRAIDDARSQYNLAPVKLAIEPGRAICGPACVALYTVGTIKKVDIGEGRTRTYVAVDGGMSVTTPDLTDFRKALQPVYDYFYKAHPEFKVLVEKILAL